MRRFPNWMCFLISCPIVCSPLVWFLSSLRLFTLFSPILVILPLFSRARRLERVVKRFWETFTSIKKSFSSSGELSIEISFVIKIHVQLFTQQIFRIRLLGFENFTGRLVDVSVFQRTNHYSIKCVECLTLVANIIYRTRVLQIFWQVYINKFSSNLSTDLSTLQEYDNQRAKKSLLISIFGENFFISKNL